MDGATVLQRPLDPISEVVKFVDDVQSLRGYKGRAIKHATGFARLYHSKLTKMQMAFALGAGLMVCAQPLTGSLAGMGWIRHRPKARTYVSSSEPLDHMYTPAFRVDSRFESYFKPTMVTDKSGALHQDLIDSGLLLNAPRKAAASA